MLEVLWIVLFAALGGALMSFFGVVTSRGAVNEPVTGRSHCACGRQLGLAENIPVIGWLRIRGKAKCCGAKIPAYYVGTEILGVLSWGVLGWFSSEFLYQRVELPIIIFAATGAFFALMVGFIYLHYAVRRKGTS